MENYSQQVAENNMKLTVGRGGRWGEGERGISHGEGLHYGILYKPSPACYISAGYVYGCLLAGVLHSYRDTGAVLQTAVGGTRDT